MPFTSVSFLSNENSLPRATSPPPSIDYDASGLSETTFFNELYAGAIKTSSFDPPILDSKTPASYLILCTVPECCSKTFETLALLSAKA